MLMGERSHQGSGNRNARRRQAGTAGRRGHGAPVGRCRRTAGRGHSPRWNVGDAASALEMLPAWMPERGAARVAAPRLRTASRSLSRPQARSDDSGHSCHPARRGRGRERADPRLAAARGRLLRQGLSTPSSSPPIQRTITTQPPGAGRHHAGDLRLEARSSHRVTADNRSCRCARRVSLLHFFMTHPDTVHSRAQLLHRVWQFIRRAWKNVPWMCTCVRLRKALEPSRCDALISDRAQRGLPFLDRVLIRGWKPLPAIRASPNKKKGRRLFPAPLHPNTGFWNLLVQVRAASGRNRSDRRHSTKRSFRK
jgi:DNA-binding winged helix-turn-helix (wHTH) protein